MIWTELTHRAYAIACMAHTGQKDKGGNPYMQHVLAVAEQMPDEELTAAALLHDVIEDTSWTAEDLAAYPSSIPLEVVAIVCAVTRYPNTGMTYMDYIRSIKRDPKAVIVKKADLKNNMDLSRLNREPTEADLSLVERYRKALAVLEEPNPWEPEYLERFLQEQSS